MNGVETTHHPERDLETLKGKDFGLSLFLVCDSAGQDNGSLTMGIKLDVTMPQWELPRRRANPTLGAPLIMSLLLALRNSPPCASLRAAPTGLTATSDRKPLVGPSPEASDREGVLSKAEGAPRTPPLRTGSVIMRGLSIPPEADIDFSTL